MNHRTPRSARRLFPLLAVAFLLAAGALRGADEPPVFFDRLMPTTSRGQPHPLVHCLIQDRQGCIWVAGPNGLARYDGNAFVYFQHRDGDPSSLSDDRLFNVFEDSRGDIWATSDSGLDLLDRRTGKFSHFRHDPGDPRSLSSNRIRAIGEDAAGHLWIGTRDAGLNRMDTVTREFTRFRHDPADANSPASDAIWCLCPSRDGKIWMGATEAGLDCYDPGTGGWRHYPWRPDVPGGLGDRHFWALREGHDGTIWVGTNEKGLYRLDPATGKFSVVHLRRREARLWDHRILSLREDRDGILWAGTAGAGLYRLDPRTGVLDRFTAAPGEAGGLSHNSVLSIIEDREGLLWFGTAGGISVLDKQRFRFGAVESVRAAKGGEGGEVLALYESRSGVLWAGTAGAGLLKEEGRTGTWGRPGLDPELAGQLMKVRVQAITEDDGGDLWIGTSSGLYRLRTRTGAFTRYRNSARGRPVLAGNGITALIPAGPGALWVGTKDGGFFEWDIREETARIFEGPAGGGLRNAQVNDLCLDREGRLWVATQWEGLLRFDRAKGEWSEYKNLPGNGRSLGSSTVYSVVEDAGGRIWVGTQAGPCLFDSERGDWIRLADVFGLPDRPAYAIVPEGDGAAWASSEAQVLKLRLEPGLSRTYGPEDGLQGGRFSVAAGVRRRSGEILFGGAEGINRFFPPEIADSPYLPPVIVTSIDLSSPPESMVPLDSPEALDVPAARLPVTVHFSAMSYSRRERNRYRVRASGPGGRVLELGAARELRLDDLRAGLNRFVIYASNHDGVWNPEGRALSLRVTVPFWTSWTWRTVLGVLIAGSSLIVLRRHRRFAKRRLLHQIGEDLSPLPERFDLTKREQEILALILQGKSNREIEAQLFISGKTVKNHIYNLYQKVGVKSRLDLINAVRDFAARNGPPASR